MPARKECPLCGEAMRFKEVETVVQVPGTSQTTTRTSREWVCPDCDYFEDADDVSDE